MLIDTHCHLQDPEAFPDPEAEIRLAREAGVERVIVVGVNLEDWGRAIAFAERFDEVFALVGWHPNYVTGYTLASLDRLRDLLSHPKVLALGEIGLDYHWDFAPREMQHRALRHQLDIAKELDLPVVFHAREAYPDLLDVLSEYLPLRTLFHCFAGTAEDAARAVSYGSYFGVDGPVSYKKADELRSVLRTIPRDRLVIETDSPYMSPVPFRGKPNRPAYVAEVNAALSVCLDLSVEACADLTTANAERFFFPSGTGK